MRRRGLALDDPTFADQISWAADRIDPPPAANRFFAHWVASPKGSGMMKPSGDGKATIGVAWAVPDRRPVWRRIA